VNVIFPPERAAPQSGEPDRKAEQLADAKVFPAKEGEQPPRTPGKDHERAATPVRGAWLEGDEGHGAGTNSRHKQRPATAAMQAICRRARPEPPDEQQRPSS